MLVYNTKLSLKKKEPIELCILSLAVEKLLTDEQDLILGELTYFRDYYFRSKWL